MQTGCGKTMYLSKFDVTVLRFVCAREMFYRCAPGFLHSDKSRQKKNLQGTVDLFYWEQFGKLLFESNNFTKTIIYFF